MHEIPPWLWNYAEYVVQKYKFDSSHDMTHFINVYNYAKKIIQEDYPNGNIIEGISRIDSLKILYYAAFSHDLIDSKYMDSKSAIEELKNIYLSNGYPEEHLNIIIFLIDNMSYSKQKIGKQLIPEKYQLIMNIIGDADKLDAYRVERVIAYQEHKNKHLEEPERSIINKNWVKTVLVKRVLKYRDFWLKTDYAKKISVHLHEKVQQYVDENLNDAEMYDY